MSCYKIEKSNIDSKMLIWSLWPQGSIHQDGFQRVVVETTFCVCVGCATSFDVYQTAFMTAPHRHAHSRTQETLRRNECLTIHKIKKTQQQCSQPLIHVQRSNVIVRPLNTLNSPVPLHHPGLPSSAFPKLGQSTPTVLSSLFLSPFYSSH